MIETILYDQPKKKSTIRIVMQAQSGPRASVDMMTWYKQMGLEDVTMWTDPPNDNAEFYTASKKVYADNGISSFNHSSQFSYKSNKQRAKKAEGRREKGVVLMIAVFGMGMIMSTACFIVEQVS